MANNFNVKQNELVRLNRKIKQIMSTGKNMIANRDLRILERNNANKRILTIQYNKEKELIKARNDLATEIKQLRNKNMLVKKNLENLQVKLVKDVNNQTKRVKNIEMMSKAIANLRTDGKSAQNQYRTIKSQLRELKAKNTTSFLD